MRSMLLAIAICSVAFALSGCSAVKAANKKGVDVDRVADCETVPCFQSMPTSELLETAEVANGDTLYRFRFQRRQGSILRAVGYGVVGVYTLGISEVITNPAEGAIQNDQMFIADAVCRGALQTCHTVIITQPGRETLLVKGDMESLKRANEPAE